LGEVVAALAERRPLPARTAVLTFDDGFLDFFAAAAPVLLRLGLPAMVFLPTKWLGKTNAWPGQPAWVEPQPLMSWEQVRELAAQGIGFGGHSVSHPSLTDIPGSEMECEVRDCGAEIAAATGRPCDFFCYPYGRWKDSVRTAVKRHYRGACSTVAAVVDANSDPFALPRVDAHYVRSPALFRVMFTAPFRGYIGSRRFVRRLRGQPEGGYSE
jgi:peptidoglycan/xylan/chitin deacetylase (PgdA/CDA1 family)